MVGGVPVFVPCHHEDGFIVRPEEIAARVTDKTKVLILNSPSNPLGCVIPRKTLEQIAALAVEKQFYVISDEIYEKLIYDGCEHVSIASLGEKIKEQTVVVNGASKAYAMIGWRIGYAPAPRTSSRPCPPSRATRPATPNSIAQYATEAALSGDGKEVAGMVHAFDERRKLMCRLINEVAGPVRRPAPWRVLHDDGPARPARQALRGAPSSTPPTPSPACFWKSSAWPWCRARRSARRANTRSSVDKIREGVRRMAEFVASLT